MKITIVLAAAVWLALFFSNFRLTSGWTLLAFGAAAALSRARPLRRN